jgi:Domain of Unknown Function (DUF1080)
MRRVLLLIPLASLLVWSWDPASAFARRRCCCCCQPAAEACTTAAPATPPVTTPTPEPPKKPAAKSPSDIGNTPMPQPAPPAPPAPKRAAPPKTTPPNSKDTTPPKTNSSAAATGPKNAEKWTSLFDGKTLGKWKVTEFGTQGPVEVKDGRLVLGFGDGCTGVTWSGDFPKLDYEIRLAAMRVEGTDFFCGLTFPVGEDALTFVVGGWGGGVVGISSLDGEDASENDTTKYMTFESNRWYTIRVRVAKDHLACWIDKEQVVDQPLADRKLSIRSEVELSRPLGIASWKTTAALRDIQWRSLTAAERK